MTEAQTDTLKLTCGDRWKPIEKAIKEFDRLRSFGVNFDNAIFKAILFVMDDLAKQMDGKGVVLAEREDGTPEALIVEACKQ